ncbi:unnamed protein product [Protopolystoma xenopodis]|uniref:Uncharacterized protein n=1 Tax=Protopolystoma xenopodis TaxID=117903 RepID=A0A448X0G8_9PLAT|nr:unnamed protein product [Protopolystoma xenopodis]
MDTDTDTDTDTDMDMGSDWRPLLASHLVPAVAAIAAAGLRRPRRVLWPEQEVSSDSLRAASRPHTPPTCRPTATAIITSINSISSIANSRSPSRPSLRLQVRQKVGPRGWAGNRVSGIRTPQPGGTRSWAARGRD